jgi:hypothetical protein
MSANADDIIPQSALAPPVATGPLDDIIPPVSLAGGSKDTATPGRASWADENLLGPSELLGSTIGNIPHAAAHAAVDLYRRWTGGDLDAPDPAAVKAIEVPLGTGGQQLKSDLIHLSGVGGPGSSVDAALRAAQERNPTPAWDPLSENAKETVRNVIGHTTAVGSDVAALAPVLGVGRSIAGSKLGASSADAGVTRLGGAAVEDFTPEAVVRRASQGQSMGAAGVAPDISVADPELRAEISNSARKTGGAVNPVALERHLDAAQLPLPEGMSPIRLRKGSATGDPQQFSDEKNLRADPDTQGILTDSIADNEKKLVASMGEIRREATPEIVQRTNQEHGQAVVDAIKDQDNQSVLDIRAKYKALADKNGGNVPIDTNATINGIDAKLSNKFLTKTAQENGVTSSVMDSLRSGNPMSFESFENARSGLAEVQRKGGSDAVAAGIVHDALENMPLSADAAPLKGLADTARAAAKARFDTIRQNPAYEAAINDNVPKDPTTRLHVIGAPSPLADSFMDRYALGNGVTASKAYVQRLKQSVPDPILSQSIEAATLNKLRDAAGIDANGNGSFRNDSYRNMTKALAPKADVLLSPQSIENTERLKRISGYENDQTKGSSVANSNTPLALQRHGAIYPTPPAGSTVGSELGGHAIDMAAAHLGPVGMIGNKIGKTIFKNAQASKAAQEAAQAAQSIKDAKLKFAQDATKPGAGLDQLPPTPATAVGAP